MAENYQSAPTIHGHIHIKYSKETFFSTCHNCMMGFRVVLVAPVLWKIRYAGFLTTCLVLVAGPCLTTTEMPINYFVYVYI